MVEKGFLCHLKVFSRVMAMLAIGWHLFAYMKIVHALHWILNAVKFMTPGPWNWPCSTQGKQEMYVLFHWDHSPGAMILGPIKYKE